MRLPDGLCLLASVCNTTFNAVPFSLWLARGEAQYVVDLSDALNCPGDAGLTGLAWHDGMLYAAVQSTRPRILVLDRNLKPHDVLESSAFADLHSLHITGDSLLVAATGNNSLIRLDLKQRTAVSLCRTDEKIHLNSACFDGDDLLICYHRLSSQDKRLSAGGVMNTATRSVLLDGLGLPHSLMPLDDGYLVLDSTGSRVIRFDHGGVRAEQKLAGFLRGAAAAGGALYVASSTRRVVSRRNPAISPARNLWQIMSERVRVYRLDRRTLTIRSAFDPIIAGFEIYELLPLALDSIEPDAERLLRPDHNSIAQLFYHAAKHPTTPQMQTGTTE